MVEDNAISAHEIAQLDYRVFTALPKEDMITFKSRTERKLDEIVELLKRYGKM